jgi:hypothetical protein
MNREKREPLLTHLATLISYLMVAAIHTFPLLTRFEAYFPGRRGDKDVFGFMWNNWWTYHALTQLHAKPYLTEYIFYPFRLDLRLHTFGLLYGLLSLPWMPVLGPVGVLNAQIFFTIALNGYCSFLLTRTLTGNAGIAFLSGLLVASVPAIDFHLDVGRPSCAALWPAICVLYFTHRLLDNPVPRLTAALAASVVATLMADQQIALFCAFWTAIVAANAVHERRRSLLDRRILGCFAAVLLIASPWAYLLYYRPLTRDLGYTVPGEIEAYNYSVTGRDLADPVVLWHAYGIILPAGVIVGLLFLRRRLWPWVFGSLAFVVLTMGPAIHGTHIPLPFMLIRRLPGLSQFRTPFRFQIPAALGMATATGMVLAQFAEVIRARTWRWLFAAVALSTIGDLMAHRLVDGFSIQTMRQEPFYAQITGDPRDCLVLEIPLGIRTGTDRVGDAEELSFYQPLHQKRLINGFAARVPLAALDYYRQSPALMFLANETPPLGDVQADLKRRLKELRVGYVVVHPDMIGADRLPQLLELLGTASDLTRLEHTGTLIVFRRDWQEDT